MPLDDHRGKFKNASKSDEARRRRAEGSVELRKTKKDEQLMKRRNVEASVEASDSPVANATGVDKPMKEVVSCATLPLNECMNIFNSGDRSRYLEAVESVRKLLSKQKSPPVDDVIQAGAVPYLVDALSSDEHKLQFEAAWALTNIASGTSRQTRTVVEFDAVPHFVRLLFSPHLYVAEQCCWAIGNITGDCSELRDIVIHAGAIQPLIDLFHKNISVEFARTLTWTISNLCRNKNPYPKNEAMEQLLPTIVQLLDHNDLAVLTDACWALAYVSDGPDDRIDIVLRHNVVPKVVAMLASSEMCLVAPSLRCLGNIVTGNDEQTQVVIDSNVLATMIPAVMKTGKSSVVKEAMWLTSNIAAGNKNQIQSIFDANLIPLIVEVLKKGDFKAQQEACWVISNITSGGSAEQIFELCRCGAVVALCDSLKSKEPKMIILVLDSLRNILTVAKKFGQLDAASSLVEECGGLDIIEQLQNHENEDIYQKALYMIEMFFNDEAEDQVNLMDGNTGRHVNSEDFDASEAPNGGFSF